MMVGEGAAKEPKKRVRNEMVGKLMKKKKEIQEGCLFFRGCFVSVA